MSKNVVTKANALIEARYSLSLQSHRLIIACLSKYDSRKSEKRPSKSVTITAFEYSELLNIDIKNAHRELYKAADSLFKSSVSLIENGHEVEVNWIQEKAKKISGEGSVTLIWSDRIMRYISQQEKNFTSYKLTGMARLQSTYSIRIYEMLMQYKLKGYRRVFLNDLREIIGATNTYQEHKKFMQKIIRPSVAELNKHSDFEIEFEQITKSQKAVAIHFQFKRKSTIKKAKEQAELDIIRDEQSSHIEAMHDDSLLNHEL